MPHSRIVARGVDFAYVERGDPCAPLALVLHGFPDSPVGMFGLLDAIAAAGYRAVAPWLRGYAPTSLAPDASYHVGSLAADANALHDVLGGGDDAVLVGHDWGASAVYPALVRAPRRWRRAAALSVPPMTCMVRAMASHAQLERSWYMWLFTTPLGVGALESRDFELVDHLWARWSPGLSPERAREPIAAAKAALSPPGHAAAAVATYRSTFEGPPSDPEAAAAQACLFERPTVPVLYLHGEDDGCIGLDAVGDPLEALPEGSRFVPVPGAGHFVHLERPDVVAETILRFFAV